MRVGRLTPEVEHWLPVESYGRYFHLPRIGPTSYLLWLDLTRTVRDLHQSQTVDVDQGRLAWRLGVKPAVLRHSIARLVSFSIFEEREEYDYGDVQYVPVYAQPLTDHELRKLADRLGMTLADVERGQQVHLAHALEQLKAS